MPERTNRNKTDSERANARQRTTQNATTSPTFAPTASSAVEWLLLRYATVQFIMKIAVDDTMVIKGVIMEGPAVRSNFMLHEIRCNRRGLLKLVGLGLGGVSVRRAVAVPEQVQPERELKPKLRRALVVEPDFPFRSQLRRILTAQGCVVDTVGLGADALWVAQGKSYHLAVVSLFLPDLHGFDVFSQLHRDSPNTLIAMMSGYGYDPSVGLIRFRQAGGKHILYKPFRQDWVWKILQDCP